jgi:hypothetical protein
LICRKRPRKQRNESPKQKKAELSLVLCRRRVGHMDRAANDAKAGIRTDGLEFGG